jgi:anti-anti-sigma factor
MPTMVRSDSTVRVSTDLPSPKFFIDLHPEGRCCVVHVVGELDLATRNQLFVAATAGNHSFMVMDLAEVSFMDCTGYGSLVAARRVIEGGDRTFMIGGQTGQPAHLLNLIAALEPSDPAKKVA